MMETLYIYEHLGLGDQIACNGIVRYYAEKYDRVYVFAKPKNTKNVMRMFRDNPKIFTMPMEEQHIAEFMKISPNNNYLIVGHQKLHEELRRDPKGRFDQVFYKMAGVPFEDKWNKFYLERNLETEQYVYFHKLELKEDEEFIFVHDDYERPMLPSKLPSGIKIIRPDRKDISIFDFLYTIEKAKEVHCIDSSFFNLIDCIKLRNDDNLFFHKYVKIHLVGEGGTPTTKLKWNVL
jgi:hypothetical protein